MININVDKNVELMSACKTLDDYSQFVGKVRLYRAKHNNLAEAISLAIDNYIKDKTAVFVTNHKYSGFVFIRYKYNFYLNKQIT